MSDEVDRIYQCVICGRAWSSKQGLRGHSLRPSLGSPILDKFALEPNANGGITELVWRIDRSGANEVPLRTSSS